MNRRRVDLYAALANTKPPSRWLRIEDRIGLVVLAVVVFATPLLVRLFA